MPSWRANANVIIAHTYISRQRTSRQRTKEYEVPMPRLARRLQFLHLPRPRVANGGRAVKGLALLHRRCPGG
eukprot:7011563-Lingulodinium_polyedra.AAC.1